MALCDQFERNPNRLLVNGATLREAVDGWRPEMPYDAPGLWLGDPLPATDENRKPYDTDTDHERTLLFNDLTKLGWPRERICAELVRRGFDGLALPTTSMADELRRRLKGSACRADNSPAAR